MSWRAFMYDERFMCRYYRYPQDPDVWWFFFGVTGATL